MPCGKKGSYGNKSMKSYMGKSKPKTKTARKTKKYGKKKK